LQQLPAQNPDDPNFRRLRYCRYADDFLLGFIGPKAEAEEITEHIKQFLQTELHLALSEAKTLIPHAKSQAARFLGYEVTTLHKATKRTTSKYRAKRRSSNGQVGLRMPRAGLLNKARREQRRGKAIHRRELVNASDDTISTSYHAELRGLANYYQLAYHMPTLQSIKWVRAPSLTKTLARKHKRSVRQVWKKYPTDLHVNGATSKGLQVIVPRAGKKPLVATWGGLPLQWDSRATPQDQPEPRSWTGRSAWEKRRSAQVGAQCGATALTATIEVHPIRALKDLQRYTGREKPAWVKLMATRHRKTLILCRTCHMDSQ